MKTLPENRSALGTFETGHELNVGRTHTEETKKKMSDSHKKMSVETRQKMREAKLGKTGPSSNNWNGGMTPLYSRIRNHHKLRQWRSDVFTRDKFSCVNCGDSKGGNLNADHIIPFIAIMRAYSISCLEDALACEKLWDINNGRTLCIGCHKKTDTYGNHAKSYIYGY